MRESGLVVVKTSFILSLTPKTPHPLLPNFGNFFKNREGFTSVFLTPNIPKMTKTVVFSVENLQILKAFPIFLGGGVCVWGGGYNNLYDI